MNEPRSASPNDNRSYHYDGPDSPDTLDYRGIMALIPQGATVVDLGCGNGMLLELLRREKNIRGCGVELSESGVKAGQAKELDVYQGRIDQQLPFQDNSFDYAVCHVTIQMVLYPEILLQEMKRIAKFQIISFPNFAFYKNRLELFFRGRMPRKMLFGYQWYSTGHIHQLSQTDFLDLVREVGGLNIVQFNAGMLSRGLKGLLMRLFPNLFQQIFIYLLRRSE